MEGASYPLTIRQEIARLLEQRNMDAREISQEIGIEERDVYRHLAHVKRSQAAREKRLLFDPPKCKSCGYVFKDRKRLTRPGRCPKCKNSTIQGPKFRIV